MRGFFRFFLILFRLVFGITFIVSGILKLIDPIGAGLIVSEYFTSFGMVFLKPVSVPFGIFLSSVELVTGLAVLVRLRIKFFSALALLLVLFFTAVTFILYKFSPIQDCGCFGEAIHLTNGQTFVKNLFLLGCILPVFFYRKRYEPVARPVAEWIFIGYHFLAACLLSVFILQTKPPAEFGEFKAGTNITDRLNDGWSGESEDVYVYEKDGVTQNFNLSDIPDTSWHFVEIIPSGAEVRTSHSFDFAVSDADGLYVTESLLNNPAPVVVFSTYEPDDLEVEDWQEMVAMTRCLNEKGIYTRILTTSAIPDSIAEYCASSDYRTLISLSRSNGGVVILNSGTVAHKGYRGEFSESELLDLLEEDSDEVAADASIFKNMFLELLFALMVLNILFFRYFCGIKRDRKAV